MKIIIILSILLTVCFTNCARKQMYVCGNAKKGDDMAMLFSPDSVKKNNNSDIPHIIIRSTFVDTIPVHKLKH